LLGHRRNDQAASLCPVDATFRTGATSRVLPELKQHLPMRISALAMARRDRRALLRGSRRTDRHPVVGEEIVRWAIWHDDCQLIMKAK